MLLHAINQAVLVKSTDNSGNSCNMRVNVPMAVIASLCSKKNAGQNRPAFFKTELTYDIGQTEARYFQFMA